MNNFRNDNNKTDLIIPVYLNQKIVFDLLAYIYDGLSTISKITTTEETKDSNDKKFGAKFGLNSALSTLFKIDLSGDVSKKKEESEKNQLNQEKIHTPSSLFQKLRTILLEKDLIRFIESDTIVSVGQFVEFSSQLSRNPVLHTLDIYRDLLKSFVAFFPNDNKAPSPKKNHIQTQTKEPSYKEIMNQLDTFSKSLREGNTIDIISSELISKHKVVITLEEEFLNDVSMGDIVDGTFKVLGKVIKVVEEDSDPINLIRKSSIAHLGKEQINIMFNALKTGAEQGNFTIPEIEYEINYPSFQVIPIGIFI